MKFGINTTSVVLEMVNFQYNTRGIYPKFPISNTTLVVFIPNFTATHAITSTNTIFLQHSCLNSTTITTQLAEAVAGILCNSYKCMNYLSLKKCKLLASQIKIIAKTLKKVSSLAELTTR